MKSYHCKSAFGCNEGVSCLMMRSVLSDRGTQMKNHCYSHATAMQQQSQGHLIAGDQVAIWMPGLLFILAWWIWCCIFSRWTTSMPRIWSGNRLEYGPCRKYFLLFSMAVLHVILVAFSVSVRGYSWLSEQSSDFCPAESNPAWCHWLWAATETGTESCNLAKDFTEGGEVLDLRIGE